jgi:putative restriction endonuclease
MRSWITMAFGGDDNPYGDIPKISYSYDDKVQNHKQVEVGDFLYMRNKTSLDGIGRIARIDEGRSEKRFRKCPQCNSGRIHERVGVKPRFRCKNGHEFDEPIVVVEPVKTFNATFEGKWLDAGHDISVLEMRPFELRDSKQLAIMPADTDGLARYIMRRRPILAAQLKDWLQIDVGSLKDVEGDAPFDPTPQGADERERIKRGIKLRRGQVGFRNGLIDRYDAACVVTGCQVLGVLEAAHIRPYRGPRDNHPTNGLLLRSDIHTLFDLDRIGIDPDILVVSIHESLRGSEYEVLEGRKLFQKGAAPDKRVLRIRWKDFMNANR